MTTPDGAETYGPYACALTPAEAEIAAARFGLRSALRGGLIASHLAPLATITLAMLFATILALTGFISRRAGEATILLAAAAYMIQRLATHWQIRRARKAGWAAMANLGAEGAPTATLDRNGVTLEAGGQARRLDYADCDEAEDAGGFIYLWPHDGAPVVLPTRALAEGEAQRLLARVRKHIDENRRR